MKKIVIKPRYIEKNFEICVIHDVSSGENEKKKKRKKGSNEVIAVPFVIRTTDIPFALQVPT